MCRSCRYVTLVQGQALSQQIKRCSNLETLVTFPVTSSNEWEDATSPTVRELDKIAWTVEARGSRHIGFVSPEERQTAGEEIGGLKC